MMVSGRIEAIDHFGKAAFVRFKDQRAYIRKDKVGDGAYELFKQLGVGDSIGLSGSMFMAKNGELTLLAEKFELGPR